MGVNVVIFGDSTLVDLREDTVKHETLFLGETAHGKDGNPVVGTFTIEDEMNEQDSLIEQIQAALQGKAAGSGDAPVIRSLSVTENGTFTAPAGVDGYSPVVVEVPVPDVPDPVDQATPVITVSDSGLITAKATQGAGVVAAGTKSATKQLTTKGATTITPGASVQTAVSAGTFVTGDIKVAAVEHSGSGDSADSDDIQFCILNNYRNLDANADPSLVIFFKSGWTWADFVASSFNKFMLGTIEELYTNAYRYAATSDTQRPIPILEVGSDDWVVGANKIDCIENESGDFQMSYNTIVPGATYFTG